MLNTVTPVMNAIRTIFVTFDIVIYYLLKFVYELFFNIATFNLLDRKMIFDMFSRVQLIIGIFMLFQLAMTIIKGIVNPDSFTDSKSGGAGNVIMRIIVSLVLLALLVPLNISDPKNEYEKQINNNGVLFGTLYSLQYRILSNNTLGRIILGDDSTNYTSSDPDNDKLTKDANKFTSLIVKTFYQLNVDDEGKYVCNDGYDEVYYQEDVDPALIISQGAEPCSSINWIVDSAIDKTVSSHIDNLDLRDLGDKYRLSFNWLSTIVGIILVILLFMIIFNVAKRAFSLAALQLLAPIPIISYMDPKGSKDSAFNAWLKLLGTTYLELFIQLAVIYFAFGVINSFIDRFDLVHLTSDMMNMQKNTYVSGPALLLWTYIILIIALFIFAKDAPKFFKQMLGIKDDGKGLFSAFGTAMGLGIAAGGAIGSFAASRQANFKSDETNAKIRARERQYQKYLAKGMNAADAATAADDWVNKYGNRYAQMHAHGAGNRAKNIVAGLFGAGAGLITGSAAASESKGNAWAKMMAATNAMNKRNRNVRNAGEDGAGFISAIGTKGEEIFTGQNEWDRMKAENDAAKEKLKYREDKLKYENEVNNMLMAIKQEAAAKAPKSLLTSGQISSNLAKLRAEKPALVPYAGFKANQSQYDAWVADIESGNGIKTIDAVTYNSLSAREKQYLTIGDTYGEFEQRLPNGQVRIWKIKTADAKVVQNEIADLNEADFAEAIIEGRSGFDNTVISASAKRFEARTGKSIKDFASLNKDGTHKTDANGNNVFSYSNMKRLMGAEDARIKEAMAKVQQEKQAIADKENSLEAKRAKARSGYFDNNGGSR